MDPKFLLMEHVEEHIKKCISEICSSKIICPHPLCNTQLDNLDFFRHHLGDVHGLTRSQREAFDAQRDADVEKYELMPITGTNVEPRKTQTRREKRKLRDQTEPVFVAWSPPPSLYSTRPKASILSSSKKRKLQDGRMQSCATLDPSYALSDVQTKLQSDTETVCGDLSDSCTEMGRNDSTLTTDNDEGQVMSNLAPLGESCHDETLTKSATEPALYASSTFECVSIPIDPALLSLSETSVSSAFEESMEREGTHALSEAEGSTPCSNISTTSIVITHIIAEDRRADQVQGPTGNEESKSEEFLQISRFAHDESKENLPRSSIISSSNDLVLSAHYAVAM